MTDIKTQYNKTLEYLASFVDYSLKPSVELVKAEFTLDHMFVLMEKLGNPQRTYPIVHIAGTKGKGSIAALISSALQAAGLTVGLYTTPYLFDFREQIRINKRPISRRDLVNTVNTLKPDLESVPGLTAFEATTGTVFYYFHQQQVDIAVIETGLGGELDATNVVTPLVSVISSISYDHTRILGNTLTQVARHKAGIIKPGRPVVSSPQLPEAAEVIRQVAQEKNSPLVEVSSDFEYQPLQQSLKEQTFSVSVKPESSLAGTKAQKLSIPLLGAHQIENAVTAYAALLVARQQSLPIPDSAIQHGFSNVKWQGRFEIVNQSPPIVLDGAHNIDSARKLSQTVQDYFPGRSVLLVIGLSEDKDAAGILTELAPRCKRVYATRSRHPRAMDVEQVAAFATDAGLSPTIANSVEDALSSALSVAQPETDLILVTGSLFVVADAHQAWKKIRKS
jgi:dihydrofolate synthase/folylpolyglutamate synthase